MSGRPHWAVMPQASAFIDLIFPSYDDWNILLFTIYMIPISPSQLAARLVRPDVRVIVDIHLLV